MSLALALALTGFASGCAYGYKNVVKSPAAKIARDDALTVTTTTNGNATPLEMRALGAAVMQKLRARGVDQARLESSDGAAKGPLLECEITDIQRVNRFQRVMVGAFAGRGWIQVRVYLKDPQSGGLLGEALVEGFSSGGTVFAGTTEDAIDEAAEQIAKFVVEEAKQ